MTSENRRQLLKVAASSLPLLAGCTSGDDGEVQDSDGDGVIDSQDYAPQDPDVQDKSDLSESAPLTESTPTATPSPTATASPTATGTNNQMSSDLDPVEVEESKVPKSTYAKSFTNSWVDVVVRSHPTIERSRVKLLSALYKFPRGDGLVFGTSEPFEAPEEGEQREVTIEFDEDERGSNDRMHHLLFAMPPDASVEDVDSDDVNFLCETDPFRIQNGKVSLDVPDEFPGAVETDAFTREILPGSYSIEVTGRTKGKPWSVGFNVWKSAYAEARNEPRGRGYEAYVKLAIQGGNASELAGFLNDDAERHGFTGKKEKTRVAIDFVQRLPYVTDDVSKGYDDYPKLVQELVVEGEGDCEDTAILLSAILEAEPFEYDMVLIELPGHMAAGIYGKDLPGYYYEQDGRKYYYIETTGEGWGIGDKPEQYQDVRARLYQV